MKKITYAIVRNFLTSNPFVRLLLFVIILIPVYIVLYKIYIPKINAFGCFDDCFNYVGGYFLSRGKQLFSQIYFNHMPLMAFISQGIQQVTQPENIFALLLRHRQFLLFYSFLFNIFLCWRFGSVGFFFTVVYEFSKFYVFGDRFLAESFIVYPLVYLAGLTLHTLLRKHIHSGEIVPAAVCAWFVIFMREPYVLAALLFFGVIVYPVLFKKTGILAIGLCIALTGALFLFFPPRDFLYNVITLNLERAAELQSGNFFGTVLLKSFFYPIYLLFAGKWNDFRIQLIAVSFLWGISMFLWVMLKKSIRIPLCLFLILGLANLRPTIPGLLYYEAFHVMIWYGLFLFSALYFFHETVYLLHKRYVFYIAGIILVSYALFSPKSFIYQRVDQQTEHITNYGHYLQVGEVIKALSTPEQTLFTDGADELLYWVANRNSSYTYSFYYPSAPDSRYYQARMKMFQETPPDIYYDFCTPEAPTHPSMPPQYLYLYVQLYSEQKPTCLYVKKTLALNLSPEQIKKANEFLYYLPE